MKGNTTTVIQSTLVKKGTGVKLQGRTLIPIVKISTYTWDNFTAVSASPLSFIVVEEDSEYLLPVAEEKIPLELLKKEIPTLDKDIAKERNTLKKEN